ncbi:hypothetical protein WJX82_000385 [Trebouxia sp. C0006]
MPALRDMGEQIKHGPS